MTLGIEKLLWMKRKLGIATAGRIPEDAEFFKDHFPGFPVLPGVLALEMLKQSAEHFLREAGYRDQYRFHLKRLRGVKFSHYLKPGDEWEAHLELQSENETEFRWIGRLHHKDQVAVSARFSIELERVPEALLVY